MCWCVGAHGTPFKNECKVIAGAHTTHQADHPAAIFAWFLKGMVRDPPWPDPVHGRGRGRGSVHRCSYLSPSRSTPEGTRNTSSTREDKSGRARRQSHRTLSTRLSQTTLRNCHYKLQMDHSLYLQELLELGASGPPQREMLCKMWVRHEIEMAGSFLFVVLFWERRRRRSGWGFLLGVGAARAPREEGQYLRNELIAQAATNYGLTLSRPSSRRSSSRSSGGRSHAAALR